MSWEGPRPSLVLRHHRRKASRRRPADPTVGFFWCVLTAHVLLWTVLPSLTQPNVPEQTLQLLSAGQEIRWGYPAQPPLAVWLAAAVSGLAAPATWPVYLLAQLCSACSVWAAWKMGRKFLHPWTALCAAIVLLGGYACTLAAATFTGDHLAGAFWSLSILMFHSALTRDRRRYWAGTGLCLALGMLSSYGTLLLLVAMFAFTLWDERARKCWDSSWPFLAGLAMCALLLPHALWLSHNGFVTIRNGLQTAPSWAHHMIHPLSYLGLQLLLVVPLIILLAPLVGWFSLEEPAAKDEDDREFARTYLLWVTCLPPAIVFALSLVAGPATGLFAGEMSWTFLGIAFLMWSHLDETRQAWRRSLVRTGTTIGLFAAALMALNIMFPQITRQAAATQFPGSQLAQAIQRAWRNEGLSGRIPVLAGPARLVRNAAWYSGAASPATTFEDLNPAVSQDQNDRSLITSGGVIVWSLDEGEQPTLATLTQRFGAVRVQEPVVLKWQSPADVAPLRVGVAIVPPQAIQPRSAPPEELSITPVEYIQLPGSPATSSPFPPETSTPPASTIPMAPRFLPEPQGQYRAE